MLAFFVLMLTVCIIGLGDPSLQKTNAPCALRVGLLGRVAGQAPT